MPENNHLSHIATLNVGNYQLEYGVSESGTQFCQFVEFFALKIEENELHFKVLGRITSHYNQNSEDTWVFYSTGELMWDSWGRSTYVNMPGLFNLIGKDY